MILIIDNYDSFTYNLVQRIAEISTALPTTVVRNDEITPDAIADLEPSHIILSPGPCTPSEAGICNDVVAAYRGRIPILGVCLGHQCIGASHRMTVTRAGKLMHGKTSEIHHDEDGIFAHLPNPFTATRYHSLIVERDTIPLDQFEISAWTDDNIVMGLRWKRDPQNAAPLDGVQFHPESFLTLYGPHLLANFLQQPRPAKTPEPILGY